MTNTSVKLKLLCLLKILTEKTDELHCLTVKEILKELENYGIKAERKSIYSDIDLLTELGIDIKCEKGRANQYHIVSRVFELPELKLLVDAVQASKFITIKKSRALIKKLEILCSKYEGKQLNRQVYVENRAKTLNEQIYYNIDKLHNAILENKQIRFRYFDYSIDKQIQLRRNGEFYVASPYGLIWAEENYYLVAYYERYDNISQFRIDRMLEIEVLEEKRYIDDENSNFNIADYSSKLFSMFSGESERVELLFDNSLVNVVIDRFGKDITLYRVDENNFKIRVHIVVSTTFLSWLFMFGDKVKILYPEELKVRMKERIELVGRMYG